MENKNNVIIIKENQYNINDIKKLKRRFKPKIVDIYLMQLKELFEVQNPQLISHPDFKKKFLKFKNEKIKKYQDLVGDWIYYSWNNILFHTLTEKENNILRTNRNKNIITAKEQKILSDFTIAIAGLSAGGNIATTLVYNGFPKKIKLADFDVLSTTNLNRARAKLSDVGQKKINITIRQLLEINPYIKIIPFPNGLSQKNLKNFIAARPKPKLIFEIIDDFKLKILIRQEAQKNKIPVVTLTSLGDSVLVDIERYDIDPKTRIFNGRVNQKILNDIINGKIGEKEKKKYAIEIVGKENLPKRVIESVINIGKTLVGRPQVMSTVTVASGIAAFIARKIALKEPVLSGRTLVKFDDFISQSNERNN